MEWSEDAPQLVPELTPEAVAAALAASHADWVASLPEGSVVLGEGMVDATTGEVTVWSSPNSQN